MTFAELAEARSTTKRAAIMLVRRHKWRRQRTNEGHTIALVPTTWAEPVAGHTEAERNRYSSDHSWGHRAGHSSSHSAYYPDPALIALENTVAALRADLSEANKRADAAIALADRTLAQLADAGVRADQAVAQADTLRATIDELRAGQMLMAETHAQDLVAAIQRAQDAAEETISQRVDRLEHDRATAVAIADEAVRAAEQLRQAAAEGKGRGRWARLKTAWRGE